MLISIQIMPILNVFNRLNFLRQGLTHSKHGQNILIHLIETFSFYDAAT